MERLEMELICPRTGGPATLLLHGTEPGVGIPAWCSQLGNGPLECPARCLAGPVQPEPN